MVIGKLHNFELTFGSFGQQYTTIDGQRYLTWFDLADRKLAGMRAGCRVEFEARPAPTVLCRSPLVEENLPSAQIVRVLPCSGPGLVEGGK